MVTGKTAGNFNNHIGVPLSLLSLPDDAEAAVIEMGMNHAGEIRASGRHRAAAHRRGHQRGSAHIEASRLERRQSRAAKRELIEALPADGIAVLNADDARVAPSPESTRAERFSTAFPRQPTSAPKRRAIRSAQGSTFDVAGVGSFFAPFRRRAA